MKRESMVGGAPPPKWKPWVLAFIAAFVAFHALVPLRYYLGDDPYDERFAWRMFSAVRAVRCSPRVVESVGDAGTPRVVPLVQVMHQAWGNLMARNRAPVIEAFLERRCEGEEDVREVTLLNTCQNARGERIPDIVWSLDCGSGELTIPEDPYPQDVGDEESGER